MSNTLVRILTGVVAIPLIIFIILQGGWWFSGFVMIVSAVALWEYYAIAEKKNAHPNKVLGILAGIILQIIFFWYHHYGNGGDGMLLALFIGFMAVFVLATQGIELWRNLENPVYNTATTVGGVGYISLFMACLIALREMYRLTVPAGGGIFREAQAGLSFSPTDDWGGKFILMVFVSIWTCDSVAYFVGRAYGKNKLFPRVSPGKSWQGAISGFLSSIAVFTVMVSMLLPGFPLHHAIILGALIGSVSQVGDLAESLLKRDAGVKDSSNIIPGHGGMFDRFDSILFIAPTVYFYLLLMLLGKI